MQNCRFSIEALEQHGRTIFAQVGQRECAVTVFGQQLDRFILAVHLIQLDAERQLRVDGREG